MKHITTLTAVSLALLTTAACGQNQNKKKKH